MVIRLKPSTIAASILLWGSLTACSGAGPVPAPSTPARSASFQSATPSPNSSRTDVVASVNGEPVSRSDWQRALALDRAMSALSGQPAPSPEASLQRLINERLVLQDASPTGFTATTNEATMRLQTLLRRWNKDDSALDRVLAEHDLTRDDALEAIRRLLIVEAHLARLGSQDDIGRWMAEYRQRARVGLYTSFSVPPTPMVLAPTSPEPPSTPLVLAPAGERPAAPASATAEAKSDLAQATPQPLPTAPPEDPAPDFTLPGLDGQPATLSRFRGRVVVLNFWASWCPSCRAEARDFGEFARRYRDRGVTVVGVNLREDAATVRAFAEANGLDYPLLLDPDGAVGRIYQVVGIPTTIIIDAAGGVRGRHVGVLDGAQLAAYVDPLLAALPASSRLAPDFTLPRENGQPVSLADYRGRPVVLLFYRSAGCGSCQQQLRAMQAEYSRFRARDAEVLAIAVQGVTHAGVVKELGKLDFPILADEAHSVSEAFGVFNRLGDGLADPAVFVIDGRGQIVWSYVGQGPGDYPIPQVILERLP
jgi:peroxiredoxin